MDTEQLSQRSSSFQGRRIHPALHLDAEFASIGIVDYQGTPWLVTSEREIISIDQPALQFETPPFAYAGIANKWDISDLHDFIAYGNVPSIGETVNWIKDVLNEYCEFQYEEEASLIACWIMGTYFHPLFPTFPRLHLHGERGTAKSKVLTIVSSLSFNGLLRVNPTPATIFRLIQPIRPTLCFDETETLQGQHREDLLSIVNSGYKRGAAVDRCAGDSHEIRSFQVYSPVALAGIAGLNRTTEDRSITIVMLRGRNWEKINREVIAEDSLFTEIRARCYRLTLSLFPRILQTRQEVQLPEWLIGRHRELYSPLITISTLSDCHDKSGLTNDLLAWAEHELNQRRAGSLETEAVLDALRPGVAQHESIIVRPKWLADVMQKALGHHISAERAGHMLRRLGFLRHRDMHGTYYVVERQRLIELDEEPN